MRCSPKHEGSFVEYAPPSMISCSEIGNADNIMSITGRSFGNSDQVQAKIAGKLCEQSKLREMHNRITCQIPERAAGKAANLAVQVGVGDQWSDPSNPADVFSYIGEPLKTPRPFKSLQELELGH
jgi:hypothetical protein